MFLWQLILAAPGIVMVLSASVYFRILGIIGLLGSLRTLAPLLLRLYRSCGGELAPAIVPTAAEDQRQSAFNGLVVLLALALMATLWTADFLRSHPSLGGILYPAIIAVNALFGWAASKLRRRMQKQGPPGITVDDVIGSLTGLTPTRGVFRPVTVNRAEPRGETQI